MVKCVAGLFAVWVLAGSSSAATIRWTLEGTVSFMQGGQATLDMLSSLGVSPGSLASGELAFESTTIDSNPDPLIGTYYGALSAFDVEIGSFHRQLNSFGQGFMVVELLRDALNGARVYAEAGVATAAWVASDSNMVLSLPEATFGQITSDALPLFPPETLGFPLHDQEWIVYLGLPITLAEIRIDVTDIRRVSEPSSALLVLLGTLALTTSRLRR